MLKPSPCMYDTTSHGGPTAGTSATILPLSLFPSHWDQAKTSSFEVQLNVLFLGHCRCHRADAAPFLGPHQTPIMSVMRCCTTCPCPNSALQTMPSSQARHSYRAPPENSEPSLSSAGSMSAALPPGCASHRGPDPKRLIQRSGLGIQGMDILIKMLLLLSWDIFRSHWTRLLMYQLMKKNKVTLRLIS